MRVRRVEPLPNPTNRPHVMVSRSLFDDFHARWAAIDREWRGVESSPGFDVTAMVSGARRHLRASVRTDAEKFPGPYLVPV